MPIDESIFKDVSPGDELSAEDLRLRMLELQRFLNGGIVPRKVTDGGDFEDSAFIKTQHIEKPEFYASPSPRIEAISSDTIYRKRSNNRLDRYYRHEPTGSVLQDNFTGARDEPSAWQTIEGMSASVFCREACTALVIGSFYVHDSGGGDGFPALDTLGVTTTRQEAALQPFLLAGRVVGESALFVDKNDGNGSVYVPNTKRRFFSRGAQKYNCRRQNHSFTVPIELSEGMNKISYKCFYRLKTRDDTLVKHLYFDSRNFVVDLLYR